MIDFEADDINILAAPHSRLNDKCINSGAVLLQHLLQPDHPTNAAACAIFTTFEMVRIREGQPLERIWRVTRHLQYWLKPIWVLPIHRADPAEHWVVCTIYPQHRFILLFDSLAGSMAWAEEIPVCRVGILVSQAFDELTLRQEIMKLIKSLILAARINGNDLNVAVDSGWKAHPVTTDRVQLSSSSCGLWVLAQIAAVLRGAHLTGISELETVELRKCLYHHILHLQ
jgi:Ulp1 family protease